MRLVIHGKKLGVIQEMDASALVVCLDSGTPVAVASDIADKVAMRTARDKSFEHTLHLLGFDMPVAKPVEVEIPASEPG